jgi:putative flippase GtrA
MSVARRPAPIPLETSALLPPSRERGHATDEGSTARSVATFARHQAGAIFVTALDFAVMTALVTLAGTSAVVGTVFGAATGGVTNFILGRKWIFAATGASARHQALRYTAVSAASLLLNAAGEYVLHDRLGLQFQIARVVIATLVSVAWNFPMHRYFVFPVQRPGPTP